MKVVFIGSGNVATQLGLALKSKGIIISQIYSRTEENAKELAEKLDTQYTSNISEIVQDADMYIYALKDSQLVNFLDKFDLPQEAIHVHTAGSIHISTFDGFAKKYGVFYPLQTFSKDKTVYFNQIPICIESSTEQVHSELEELAYLLTMKVYSLNSEQRRQLHLAAVFACNFTNYMYDIAYEVIGKAGIGFEILHPLIMETANKVKTTTPFKAQTGPAIRYDKKTIKKHLWMLKEEPDFKKVYLELSNDIHKRHKKGKLETTFSSKLTNKLFQLFFSKQNK